MTVTVRAPWAERYTGAAEVCVTAPEGLTAQEAAARSGIPDEEIGLLELAGVLTPPDRALREGDVLTVYPVIIGG